MLFALKSFDMRLAISTWADRISPLFDTAKCLLVVDVENGAVASRREEAVSETEPTGRTMHIANLGVDVLICGAISQSFEMELISAGVQVIPMTCGLVEDVLQAFVSGKLTKQAFLMPGCHRHRRFRGGRHGNRGGFNG